MATHLWSCRYPNKIYQHTGGTSSITTSFSSPGTHPWGLAWDGTNLWSCDSNLDKIYQHTGGTSSIATSFSSPSSSPGGLAWDGTNLWSCDTGKNKIYQHTGGTSSITTSFLSPNYFPSGLTWDGTNLWSCSQTLKIYQHTGGTSSITTSFSSPSGSSSGLARDGTNLWSCDSNTNKIYQHTGGTSSITTSFSSPGTFPLGLTWQPEPPVVAPTVTTQAADTIVPGGATLNGNITDDGGGSITQHGFCWKAGSDPVNIAGADGNSTLGAGAEGAFDQVKTDLNEKTLYYYRGYATNSNSTAYGDAQSFTTLRVPRNPAINFQNPAIF